MRIAKNLGGASEPRPGPSTFDPYSRRPPSCIDIDIEPTSTLDNLANSRGNTNPPRSQRCTGATKPNSWAAQREGLFTTGDRTAIYRQPSDHHRSATHQELGVSRISFRCLGCIRAHFATGVENVKQHSALFFCAKESACNFPLESSSFARPRSRFAMTARHESRTARTPISITCQQVRRA